MRKNPYWGLYPLIRTFLFSLDNNVYINYNSHNDNISYFDYLKFTRSWLSRCYDIMKDDGRFFLTIPLDKNKGGQQSVGADITALAKEPPTA